MNDLNTSSEPTVLVVDDDPDIRANMEDVLSAFGYRVDLAADGERASELAARNLYDVALVDLRMPGIDGVELYQRIKRIQAGVAVFIITGFAETDRARAATEAGAWEVVSKPLDVARLLESIRGALRRPLLIVVDDDQELCLSLWDVLRQHAYRVCLAHDVEDAERKLAVRQYDAALIDLRLPGGGGIAVLQSLRQRNTEARAIVMVSDERASDATLALEFEQAGIPLFVKPLDLDRLLAAIGSPEAR